MRAWQFCKIWRHAVFTTVVNGWRTGAAPAELTRIHANIFLPDFFPGEVVGDHRAIRAEVSVDSFAIAGGRFAGEGIAIVRVVFRFPFGRDFLPHRLPRRLFETSHFPRVNFIRPGTAAVTTLATTSPTAGTTSSASRWLAARCPAAAARPAATAKSTSALRLGLTVRKGRGNENFVADDDGAGPCHAGHGDFPSDVLLAGPFDGQLNVCDRTRAIGTTEVRPIGGNQRAHSRRPEDGG